MQWRNLSAAFAAMAVFGFTFGMTYPLLSLLLDRVGAQCAVVLISHDLPTVAWACDRFELAAFASIYRAVLGSDVTVVMLHGGVEVTDCPGPRLRDVV